MVIAISEPGTGTMAPECCVLTAYAGVDVLPQDYIAQYYPDIQERTFTGAAIADVRSSMYSYWSALNASVVGCKACWRG